MAQQTKDKISLVNDQIKFVNHMTQVIRKGFLGSNEETVFGEEPSRRFFSGVLFSKEFFIQDIGSGEEKDPDTKYSSISKNCSIGLEFLCKPDRNAVKGILSGKFSIYIRLIPTFQEHMESIDYLYENSFEVEENDSPRHIDEDSKGIALLEKYEKVDVYFNDYEFNINIGELDSYTIPLRNLVQSALAEHIIREDLFNVNPNSIHKTGTVYLPKGCVTEEHFNNFIESIRAEEINLPNWNLSLNIDPINYREGDDSDNIKIIISMVNETPINNDGANTGHSTQLFDCQLNVKIIKGKHNPFIFDGAFNDYKLDRSYDVKGLNCTGIATEKLETVILSTEVIPTYFQKLYRTKEDFSVEFNSLATPTTATATLRNVLSEMNDYLNEWKSFINQRGDEETQLKTKEEITKCSQDAYEFEEEIKSFELGIYCLERDKRLMEAFNTMNKVFAESGKGKFVSWRLFQIVFIVRMIPSLYNREIKSDDPRYEEVLKSSNYADVLWFPTGGGKTEAYLGIIITALFYDRLRGKRLGVSAWLRFPLRMLSKNQLDRLAKILIIAEKFRQETDTLKDTGVPFSIGFFAGSGNTDNFVSPAKVKKAFTNESTKKNKMLLHKCPNCNSKLDFEFDEIKWRYIHKCKNASCFVFTNEKLNGVVPIYITDSEVYRFLPSVICGTVDKLAILGRYREFTHIFGQIGGICSNHGFFSDRCIVGAYDNYDSCSEKTKKTGKAQVTAVKEKIYDPIPSLFIQDELHLLKEELGALDAHYESVLIEYARVFGRKETHLPKVIAATATIEAYENHINNLYMRKPRKYPSMGYKTGESFYATSTPKINRRLYMGVLPHNKSQEEVIGRAIYLYQTEIQRLLKQPKESIRELELTTVRNKEEMLDFLANYDLSTVYVNKKSMGTDIARRLDEMKQFPEKLSTELLTGENDMEKIVEVIDRIESEGSNKDYKEKLQVLIATSLISHGVDLERVNNFYMAGMPSKQAEYIQASSRSARTHVGFVFVSFKPTDIRERSQYQFFVQNHIFLDRLVDPVPINRMALKAIERTLPGILSGLLLGVHSQDYQNTIYDCGSFTKYVATSRAKGIDVQNVILEQLFRIYGVYDDKFSLSSREKVKDFVHKLFLQKEHLLNTSSATQKIKSEEILNPITSFRDIEEGIDLIPTLDTSLILRNLINIVPEDV